MDKNKFNSTKKWKKMVTGTSDGIEAPKTQEDVGSKRIAAVANISKAYEHIERREITVKNVQDLHRLGGVYSSQMLNYSRKIEQKLFDDDDFEDEYRPNKLLKLPHDGTIFHDGIPFHHFVLSPLEPKHIRRLKKFGITIKHTPFSKAEDQQIIENWKSYAAAHKIPENEGPLYFSAATLRETPEMHVERLRFIHQTLFRPWICSRLLDRTTAQVFRRAYHLFRISATASEFINEWTAEDDRLLLELVQLHGHSWELIGNELLRCRYSCRKRYKKLIAECESEKGTESEKSAIEGNEAEADVSTNSDTAKWSRIEIARFYEFLNESLQCSPVLVALSPQYQHYETLIDWDSPMLKLPSRNTENRKEEWAHLKSAFIEASQQMDVEVPVKEILRAVIPEDTEMLSKAKVTRTVGLGHIVLTTGQLAERVSLLHQHCLEEKIDKLRTISKKSLKKRFMNAGIEFSSAHRMGQFIRRVKYMLYILVGTNVLGMLPLEHDSLPTQLELLAFVLRNINEFKVKKRRIRKYAKRFLRIKGWQRSKQIVLVNKAEGDRLRHNGGGEDEPRDDLKLHWCIK